MTCEVRASMRGLAAVSRRDSDVGDHGHGTIVHAAAVRGEPSVATSGVVVFAAMPFATTFDDVFYVGITTAAEALGGTAVRVDHVMHGGDAVAETERLLRACHVVVADVSTNEPDVLYELGFARALGKPTVQLCSTSHANLPFMVRNYETLLYSPGQTHLLGQQLQMFLKRMLSL